MCHCLDTKLMEYAINILDILSDLYFAWLIWDACIGWSIPVLILSIMGMVGFLMKFCAQCYRKERFNVRTKQKQLYWRKDCTTSYFFGVIIELVFEGLFIGIIEAIIVGNGQMSELMNNYGIAIVIIIIKLIYCLYMVFKYFMVSREDPFKIWFIMLSVAVMIIVYSIAICSLFDIFNSISFANCMN
eukprot:417050_1